jgi:hypothetical protein
VTSTLRPPLPPAVWRPYPATVLRAAACSVVPVAGLVTTAVARGELSRVLETTVTRPTAKPNMILVRLTIPPC